MRLCGVRLCGVLVLALVIVSKNAAAQSHAAALPMGSAIKLGLDPEQLNRAASLVEHAVEDDEIPAAVIFVACQGEVVLHRAFGFRDAARTQPLQKNALFRMASNSKAVTAAGILLLVQDGQLQLDDPVAKFLPAFANETWKSVTVRHLLTHTSGCRIKRLFLKPLLSFDSQAAAQSPIGSRLVREVIRFAEIPTEAEAGETWSYNNAGFNILAGLIEHLTGSYQEFLRARLYQPLGMLDSCNHESRADHNRMSTVMKRQQDGSWQPGWTPGDPPDWPFARGSGGMVSTAADYALFCQMLLRQGDAKNDSILRADLVAEMTSPQQDQCPAAKTYGLGWKVQEAGGVFSHTGSDGTFVWVDPQRELIGMLFTQTNGASIPRTVFREAVEAAWRGVGNGNSTVPAAD